MSLLQNYQKEHKVFYMVSLDLSKAFDSVSHFSLKWRFHALNFPVLMQWYLISIHVGNTTDICWGKNQIANFNMSHGVIVTPMKFTMSLGDLPLAKTNRQGLK